VHLGEEALDDHLAAAAAAVAASAASPEVEVQPDLVPGADTALHQGLDGVELGAWMPGVVMAESVEDIGKDEGIARLLRTPRRQRRRRLVVPLPDALALAELLLQS